MLIFERLLNAQPLDCFESMLPFDRLGYHESVADHRLGLASNPVLLPETRQLRMLVRVYTQISTLVGPRDVSRPLHPFETQHPK